MYIQARILRDCDLGGTSFKCGALARLTERQRDEGVRQRCIDLSPAAIEQARKEQDGRPATPQSTPLPVFEISGRTVQVILNDRQRDKLLNELPRKASDDVRRMFLDNTLDRAAMMLELRSTVTRETKERLSSLQKSAANFRHKLFAIRNDSAALAAIEGTLTLAAIEGALTLAAIDDVSASLRQSWAVADALDKGIKRLLENTEDGSRESDGAFAVRVCEMLVREWYARFDEWPKATTRSDGNAFALFARVFSECCGIGAVGHVIARKAIKRAKDAE